MNIFDKILASGYYAFSGELNAHMVRMYITSERKKGTKFNRDDLKKGDIEKYMEFNNGFYVLKNGYTIDDISMFIDWNIVAEFHNLKKKRDYYYSIGVKKDEPDFESAMKKLKRY